MKTLHETIMESIETTFIGKSEQVKKVLVALFAQGHVLIEDVPGVGKTSLSKALAASINGSFKRIQFTPDTTPSDIIGFNMFNVESQQFEYIEGAVLNNIVLADELNRTSPKTQAALLEAMQEGKITVDGDTFEIPKPFILIATQNMNEQFGTYPLPESQLDRFMLSIQLGYPEREVAENILKGISTETESKDSISLEDLEKVQSEVEKVHISEGVLEYIIDIAEATR
jgi:MoxR-like ATPase